MRLRWKLEPRETGLRRIGCGPRGIWLTDGSQLYAHVSALCGGYRGTVTGWYFVAGWDSGVPYANTCRAPYKTVDEAKSKAMEYVKTELAKRALQSTKEQP